MHFSKVFAVSALAASAHGFEFPSLFNKREAPTCPELWFDISKELTGMFLADGICTDHARAAIRGVFHDCFPSGGCDGSLVLFDEELSRIPNTPMIELMTILRGMAIKYNVGAADLLMFAGCKFHSSVSFHSLVLTDYAQHMQLQPALVDQSPRL